MKSLIAWTGSVAVAALLLAGCDQVTDQGGPGVNPPGQENVDEATFELSLPDVSVNQGESQEATISIDAGSAFHQTVAVTLTPPEGITVDPQQFELSENQADQTVIVQADAAATEGDHAIKVAGTPETGDPVDGNIMVTVAVKEAARDDSPALDDGADEDADEDSPQ